MAIKEVKAGEKYTLELLGVGMTQDKFTDGEWGTLELPSGRLVTIRPCDFEALSPARQDVRSEHSTVGTLNSVERVEKLWNGMWDVLFDDDCQKYAEDLSKAMRNHIKSITPDNENGIKNTETAPKYDPTRKFRKGDIVKPCQVKGRWQSITWKGRSGIHFTVTEDEDENGIVSIKDPDCKLPYITSAVFFELVTPVEELETSRVFNDKKMGAWIVTKGDFTHAYFPYRCEVSDNIANSKEEAKAAAEAERDRLNAEWRKKQSNG